MSRVERMERPREGGRGRERNNAHMLRSSRHACMTWLLAAPSPAAEASAHNSWETRFRASSLVNPPKLLTIQNFSEICARL